MIFKKRIVFFILIFFNPLAYGDTVDISLEELAAICETAEDSILDVTVEYEFSVDPLPEPRSGTFADAGPSKIKWTGAKPFSELSLYSEESSVKNVSDQTWNIHTSSSYNGKIAKRYHFEDQPARKISEGVITNNKKPMPRWSKTPLIYTSHFFQLIYGRSLHEILRAKDTELIKLDNEIKEVNGFNTIRVDMYVRIEGTKAHLKSMYFSPEHNFTIVKIELYNGKQAVVAYDVLELKEVKDGIWFPVSGCIAPSSPTNAKNIYKATSVVINQGLKKEHFDIEFPAGTEIFNETVDLRYIYIILSLALIAGAFFIIRRITNTGQQL